MRLDDEEEITPIKLPVMSMMSTGCSATGGETTYVEKIKMKKKVSDGGEM